MAKGGGASRPRFRLLPTVLLTAAILALPTVVYGWGRNSSSFAIHKVVVSGTQLVPERRVLRLLRRDYLGHNLFTVTTKDVRASLTPLYYISDAWVDRDFPATLRVSVVEYTPAVYALAGDRWYVIAADGHVICEEKQPESSKGDAGAAPGEVTSTAQAALAGSETTATAGAPVAAAGLPAPTGKAARLLAVLQAGPPGASLRLPRLAADGPLAAGTTLAAEGVRAALPVVAGLPRALRERLAVVEVTREGQLTLRFAGGPVVIWGVAERTLAKTLALRVVLDRYATASRDCVFVDVSTPDRVLARPVLK
ncbi:MAG: FtsQ-type POTRA domain-containing protein [Actinobacteria bacterium]|nr:FtsQ-type POTRA domain-containing protein [Actinomycetota bacterium]